MNYIIAGLAAGVFSLWLFALAGEPTVDRIPTYLLTGNEELNSQWSDEAFNIQGSTPGYWDTVE